MSDSGLRLRDSAGNIILSSPDRITRFRYATVAGPGANGSVNLPDIGGSDSIEIAIPVNTGVNIHPHTVYRSGTTIVWNATQAAPAYFPSGTTTIFVFLYT